MSAIFNFQSLLTVVLLLICTCAYIRSITPRMLDKNKEGLLGIFWKCARIGQKYCLEKFGSKRKASEFKILGTMETS